MSLNKESLVIDKYKDVARKNPSSMAKAIRAHCVECAGGSLASVKECMIPECSLYSFRMGRRTVCE